MTIAITDPLYAFQWHLHGPYGVRAHRVWDDYTGRGVTVVVYDSGVDQAHWDLDANVDLARQLDTASGRNYGWPVNGDAHGTACAGLVAAERNGAGGVGVAFDATIVAFAEREGWSGVTRTVGWREAARFDVINNSWGGGGFFADNFDLPENQPAAEARIAATVNGRSGLGTIFVQAGGNFRERGDDVNLHNIANQTRSVTVAATTESGDVTGYSTPGAAILVAAPGSEPSSILTTDISGSGGYDPGDYMHRFAGTSASAPIVSGVVALMLDANDALGWRDVQEILAYSARNSDPEQSSTQWQINGARNWNGGGLHVSHDLGVGLVDAHAAVRLAEYWPYRGLGGDGTARASHNETRTTLSEAPSASIPDNDPTGVARSLTVTENVQIDHVAVTLAIDHTYIGDLQVVLRSPAGTQSILVNRPGKGLASMDGIVFALTSTQHWGESSAGTWTLTVRDLAGHDVGVLREWGLFLQGDPVSPDDVYVYTDEFAATAGATRETLVDSAGDDYLLAAALSGDAIINLVPGATSVLAGRKLVIDASTVIERAAAGDGNDVIAGNGAGNVLHGARGNDQLIGHGGNDFLSGGPGVDTAVFARAYLEYRSSVSAGMGTLDGPEGRDELASIENLGFVDGRLAFDPGDHMAQAYRLYLATLDRAPDALGLNFQSARLDAGTRLADVASGFVSSPEFQSTYGSLASEQLVDLLYRNVLERSAAPNEIAFHVSRLQSGASPSDIVVGFSESPEHIRKHLDALRPGLWDIDEGLAGIARLYFGMLERTPETAGLVFYKDALVRGLTVAEAANGFAASVEFQARYGPLDDAAYVTQLYANILERPAAADEVAFHVNRLAAGASRGDAAAGFTEAPEYQAKVLPFFEHGIAVADAGFVLA
jgi:subtilisin-like proprotein convertase family protein